MTTNSVIIQDFKTHWKSDLVSGFLVFLIALPLCIGIALASGFPTLSGIITAVIGGLLVTFIGGGHVAIKGPAAGLIVIALGAVTELGAGQADPLAGYKLALAAIVISGILQAMLGVLKAGSLSDFFPSSAVHGLLASIGIIIFSKQIHVALGVKPDAKEPLELLAAIPSSLKNMNPEIALIGLVSLFILFTLPLIKNNIIKKIPAPMLVILVAIPLGKYFDLDHIHKFTFWEQAFTIDPAKVLVNIPNNIMDGFNFPDWSMVTSIVTWKYVIMFTLVGSLESVLSAKAVDVLDPQKRKTQMNKDLIGVGIGNAIAGLLGGLPMITEIVRSSANINNGAKTKWSNFYHGIFLLSFVAFVPGLIHQIPLAALAGMLIFTGYRLASPKVFAEILKVGKDQFAVFLLTIIVTLATDLLVGIFAGILIEYILQLYAGAKLKYVFSSQVNEVENENNQTLIKVTGVVTFSNYLGLKNKISQHHLSEQLILDFAEVEFIDHTVMEHLHLLGEDFNNAGGKLKIINREKLVPTSSHPLSNRILTKNAISAETSISRETRLKSFAKNQGFVYQSDYQKITTNFGKLATDNSVVKYEGNILTKITDQVQYRYSDLSVVYGGDFKAGVSNVTVLSVSNLHYNIPLFVLRQENLFESAFLSDIDFKDFPLFSNRYMLIGLSEAQVRQFFTREVILLLEKEQVIYNIESLGSELIIYRSGKIGQEEDLLKMSDFANRFIQVIKANA
jgi:MFS superfamily sulfate permease-like transporter